MGEITLDLYKGSNIEKGFSNKKLDESQIMETVVGNFQKGLIDSETFEKAIGEMNLMKGEASVGTTIPVNSKVDVVKKENGWAIEKAVSDYDDQEDEEGEEEDDKGEEPGDDDQDKE